jgi:phosphoglycolate phosphatase
VGLQAAIFDLDGTLVDSLPGIEFAVDSAFAELGLPVRNKDLAPLIGPPIHDILGQLLPQADEQQLSCLEAGFRASYDTYGWQKTILHENAALVLAKLERAGVQLFIVTNKPTFATHRILEALGILPRFEAVLCRDGRTPCFGSKAEMLENLVRTCNLHRDECLYIGDTYEDYLAGTESGIRVALVRRGEICDHRQYQGCVTVKNLIELLPDDIELEEIA